MRRLFGADSLRSDNRLSFDTAPHCGARDFLCPGRRAAKSSGSSAGATVGLPRLHVGPVPQAHAVRPGPGRGEDRRREGRSEAIQLYTIGRAHPKRSAMWMADTR